MFFFLYSIAIKEKIIGLQQHLVLLEQKVCSVNHVNLFLCLQYIFVAILAAALGRTKTKMTELIKTKTPTTARYGCDDYRMAAALR